MNSNGTQGWLKQNSWNLIVTAITVILAFAAIQARVSAVELRHDILEEKIAEYPSQDWFELKFENIDKKFNVLENKIDE